MNFPSKPAQTQPTVPAPASGTPAVFVRTSKGTIVLKENELFNSINLLFYQNI